jgi:hypothetical protein
MLAHIWVDLKFENQNRKEKKKRNKKQKRRRHSPARPSKTSPLRLSLDTLVMSEIGVDWDILREYLIYYGFIPSPIPPKHSNPKVSKLGLHVFSTTMHPTILAERVLAGHTLYCRWAMAPGSSPSPIRPSLTPTPRPVRSASPSRRPRALPGIVGCHVDPPCQDYLLCEFVQMNHARNPDRDPTYGRAPPLEIYSPDDHLCPSSDKPRAE